MTESLSDIRAAVESSIDTEYARKYMHPVPETTVIDRASFILDRCRDKIVLSLGASGPMQDAVDDVAKQSYCVDIEPSPGREHYYQMDLDALGPDNQLPLIKTVEVVLMGEIVEHLTNPGTLLRTVRRFYPDAEKIITVPNAMSEAARRNILKGIENVNPDHCFWPSYTTMLSMLTKCGLQIKHWWWYNGKPLTAEGLIFVVR